MKQMASDNPKLFALMEMMKQQSDSGAKTKENSTTSQALKKEVYKRKKLLRRLQEVQKDLINLEAFMDEVAASLGACTNCWGTHSSCSICEGKGGPGHFPPDKMGFQQYVLPVLRNTPWVRQLLIKELNN